MKGLDLYLLPYLISQVISLLILLAAWKNTRLGRILFAVLFFYAGIYNMYIGFTKPNEYLGFANLALPFYKDFINGWFSRHHHIIIPLIAAGQLLIAAGMMWKNGWVKWACAGAIAFLLSIAPLMVGSAFPFSITVSVAAIIILKNDDKTAFWKSKDQTIKTKA